jgi:hypothetical protein
VKLVELPNRKIAEYEWWGMRVDNVQKAINWMKQKVCPKTLPISLLLKDDIMLIENQVQPSPNPYKLNFSNECFAMFIGNEENGFLTTRIFKKNGKGKTLWENAGKSLKSVVGLFKELIGKHNG